MEIKNLELTERDFQLLVEALDFLPEKDMASNLMGDLFMGIMARDDKEAQNKIIEERKRAMAKQKSEKEQFKEDIRILQGKLLMFKRFLIQQNALKQVDDILNS